MHSNFSDGSFSIAEIVLIAKKNRLATISITDHDNIEGVPEAINLGVNCNVEVISGVEISTAQDGEQIHILGYNYDPSNTDLCFLLKSIKETRECRIKSMLKILRGVGIVLSFNELSQRYKGTLGRLNLAEFMEEKGIVRQKEEAFDKYIGKNRIAYSIINLVTPKEAIRLIKNSGGISVLAHPSNTIRNCLINNLISYGLDGIEVFHPSHSMSDINRLLTTAKDNNLIITGGSDFHGITKRGVAIGEIKIPSFYITQFKKSVLAMKKRCES